MGEWKQTSCVLCAQNCGLEVFVENNTIEKVRGDKKNPRSKGYVCNKGTNIAFHHHHSDRLTTPLKKTEQGFVPISWDQAISEISEKLKNIIGRHGPRSFAYMGGGGQGTHFEAGFGMSFLRGLGSRYNYNALAQELTGYFWVCGRMMGRQNRFAIPHEDGADMMLAIGWNGMQSHQVPRAPLVLREFAQNPDKLLVVIDPRKSETARIANIHLPVRPGADALLFRAMIALILEKGWEDREFLKTKVSGFDQVELWFRNFDIRAALEVCQLEYDAVENLCGQLATRKWCMHPDLGVWMNRHSTVTAYLMMLLSTICGRSGVRGGNVIPGTVVPLGSHSDERDPKTWRTVHTDFPAILGAFPPNVMPEEIMNDNPERLRAVITCASNPLRSFADTTEYEKAFARLDLLVTIELAMTETARMAHYVLPARSGLESWDSTFFQWNYPEIYFHLRRPVVEPEGERQECGEIFTRLAEGAGLVPEIPEYLKKAAQKDRFAFAAAFISYLKANPKAMKSLPFILARTLGAKFGSAHLAAAWGIIFAMPGPSWKNAVRAGYPIRPAFTVLFRPHHIARAIFYCIRYRSIVPLFALSPKIEQSERIFQELLDKPEGIWIGRLDPDRNQDELRTEDGRINMFIPELSDWVIGITPASEAAELAPDPEYPFILNAGRHTNRVANTLMRDPEWVRGKRACTLAMNPEDAASLSLADGDMARISTHAGSADIEVELTDDTRKGQVLIPHGFGLIHGGNTYGVNVNTLTKNIWRDKLAATPLHRYVPCRIERIS
ncbi:MAG: molybdopterin dinucleotide-binding protein [Spirochaetae bacterium HGW-Spirochaetae-1]|jgi:anaerobic selenocysteine-containing dehydrogenase|nr:MAG: molybdopterin dinucleotide-binding protein [Spirochaetae bacterium HGW-Spirochaetae-1]